MEKLDYWQKSPKLSAFKDLEWNIPEQKSGTISLIGGNSQNFSCVIRCAEFLEKTYPIARLNIVLPNALRSKLPSLPNLFFTPSTESGSFAKSNELDELVNTADFSIFIGDLSKNSATTIAVSSAITKSNSKILLTRDSVDLIAPEMVNLIEKENQFIIASMAQLQKLFRAIYYPKMLLLSMPLLPAIETLHKFTLSYPATILTFHQEQIIIANSGQVITIPITDTDYSPIALWAGDLACKIAAMNLYTPDQPLKATAAALS